mmetsp:Transcript_26582/g.41250  ORF Transcript_26582/g.41250 Transcript_26582/m.41250 type:complete len:333 (-) Transcript_26582:40-1038(-)
MSEGCNGRLGVIGLVPSRIFENGQGDRRKHIVHMYCFTHYIIEKVALIQMRRKAVATALILQPRPRQRLTIKLIAHHLHHGQCSNLPNAIFLRQNIWNVHRLGFPIRACDGTFGRAPWLTVGFAVERKIVRADAQNVSDFVYVHANVQFDVFVADLIVVVEIDFIQTDFDSSSNGTIKFLLVQTGTSACEGIAAAIIFEADINDQICIFHPMRLIIGRNRNTAAFIIVENHRIDERSNGQCFRPDLDRFREDVVDESVDAAIITIAVALSPLQFVRVDAYAHFFKFGSASSPPSPLLMLRSQMMIAALIVHRIGLLKKMMIHQQRKIKRQQR